ncbi:hypothetical protein RHSIM_Rhsim06G0159500 [Rhododendron simsii]|uniref:Late embryogenesis abundant protein LEA-2 subgroup domain-containing protein n=1 Tax=Rhododendron simsii TaxID=118357 RepID=A0A834GU49_RHOSS|nr:hypothetical protein RHSIM_Rhsim06G0159500 [Rhododendron simsii]
MPGAKSFRKGLKICCCTTFVLLIVLAIVCVTLYFTMFKPKHPQVTAHPVSLENIEVQIFPAFILNVTIGLVVTINNRNYGSFKYQNSTSYINYRGTNIAEVPIEGGTVPARRKFNLSTYANVAADKLITNSHFLSDIIAGSFNSTSTATLVWSPTAIRKSNCDVGRESLLGLIDDGPAEEIVIDAALTSEVDANYAMVEEAKDKIAQVKSEIKEVQMDRNKSLDTEN